MSDGGLVVLYVVGFAIGALQLWALVVVIGLGSTARRIADTLDSMERLMKNQAAGPAATAAASPSRVRKCPACGAWMRSTLTECEACHAAMPPDPF